MSEMRENRFSEGGGMVLHLLFAVWWGWSFTMHADGMPESRPASRPVPDCCAA